MTTQSGLTPYTEALGVWLEGYGLSPSIASLLAGLAFICAALLIGLVGQAIASRVIRRHVVGLIKRTKSGFDDFLYQHNVFSKLSRILPSALIILVASAALDEHATLKAFVVRSALIYMVIVVTGTIRKLLEVFEEYYRQLPHLGVPIKSYVQMVSLICLIAAGVLILTIALNQSPLTFLSGLGALSAVILLLFRDPLLGLAASVQLAASDMVRLGDWIEVTQHGADGEVIDITLTTVKVKNWDKTLSLLPAYSLVSGGFKNWRTMSEAGGRRIKRSIPIDMHSIKRCTEAQLDALSEIVLIKEYIEQKRAEIKHHNQALELPGGHAINGRQLTNIGLFRVYIEHYLRSEDGFRDDLAFMVRQLEPGVRGIFIEVYVFADTTEWLPYECIQADLFDHLLSVSRCFGLRVFQLPGGEDVRDLAQSSAPLAPTN